MFLDYFHLNEQPFGVTPDPRYLFANESHRQAMAALVDSYESALGFACLIAEPGIGKTTLLHSLLARIGSKTRNAYMFETQCDSREMLSHLLCDLDQNPSELDMNAMFRLFRDLVITAAQSGHGVLIIIDEAQNLHIPVLETVRLLSNFETPTRKLVHVVLAGQPQLAETLGRPELAQLRQRITTRVSLEPLSPSAVHEYVTHRLHIAGHRGAALFTEDALDLIAQRSRGIPREINRMCYDALTLCCAVGRSSVGADLVGDADTGHEFVPERVAGITRAALASLDRDGLTPSVQDRPSRVLPNASSRPRPFSVMTRNEDSDRTRERPPAFSVAHGAGAAPSIVKLPQTSEHAPSERTSESTLSYAERWARGDGKRFRGVVLGAVLLIACLVVSLSATRSKPAPAPPTNAEERNHATDATDAPATTPEAVGDPKESIPVTPAESTPPKTPKEPRRKQLKEPASRSTTMALPPRDQSRNEGADEATDTFRITRVPVNRNDPGATVEPPLDPQDLNVPRDESSTLPVVATAQPGPPTLDKSVSAHGSSSVSREASTGTVLTHVEPEYPAAARRAQIGGPVVLRAHVDQQGRVTTVHAITGNSMLAAAAVSAVRQWIYEPFMVNGRSVEADTTVVVNFDPH